MSLTARDPGDYSDADFEAAKAARIQSATDARVTDYSDADFEAAEAARIHARVGDYSDADFEAAEAARIRSATDARVTIADVMREVRALRTDFAEVITLAQHVREQVEPTLTALEGNPMFRMFLGKGKR